MSSTQIVTPKLIFDTDANDVLALLLLLTSGEAELALITVTFGNTELKHAYTNVLKVYQLILDHLERHPNDRAKFPGFNSRPKLCSGASGPLSGIPHLAQYFHGRDGLSDISTTHPEFNVRDPSSLSEVLQESETPAEDAIIELLLESPEDSVTIVAVGPLTNIARAWLKDPKALRRSRRVVVMGGALDVPGNTSATAEFNFFADPQAAAIVMDAAKSESINLLLAPLDITTQHGVPYTHLIHPRLLSGPLINGTELSQTMSPLRAFTSAFLHRVRRVTRELGIPDVLDMHDPLAVWAGLAHAALPREAPLLQGWEVRQRDFVMECDGKYTKGMCVLDRRGTTDETGGVRSIDGVQGIDKAKSKPTTGVKILTATPGLATLEKLIVEKIFWDLRQSKFTAISCLHSHPINICSLNRSSGMSTVNLPVPNFSVMLSSKIRRVVSGTHNTVRSTLLKQHDSIALRSRARAIQSTGGLDVQIASPPSTTTPLHKIIHGSIQAKGPISVAQYMQMCLSHPVEGYYMKGEPIGARGDFTTSPEISQLFGEIACRNLVGFSMA
ncbi:Uridine nucleosidase 1 OS=Arabidopsis thaliana GN=URH1 PE=1 SV=2 [Rhizoctonia solani AG-1 IB]|uniref:Uridine nucleosidase 1 n=1 Tax=Thanatephorus cucumeris (strain AG1-IB / isolate 7/3/14) TaxID=1108050 RepID=A0A0B7FCA3_THACB|nr:Uridine nucleosidase 1 OS=Arabidopsis thaliana GN=URH1 PE=1 SV=2 [Rhizoctonia solani AG-1 IB]